jgi:hypothetical protein
MYDLTERLIECRDVFAFSKVLYLYSQDFKAVETFCTKADRHLPKLKKKKYSDYMLEPDEWTILELIKEVLHVCRHHFFKCLSLSLTFIRNPDLLKLISHPKLSQLCGKQSQFWNVCLTDGKFCLNQRNLPHFSMQF